MNDVLHAQGLCFRMTAAGVAVALMGWVSGSLAQPPSPTLPVQTWSTTPAAPPAPPAVGFVATGPAPALEVVESAFRLGRIALVAGTAQIWDASQAQWVPLELNRPVTGGDRIRTERDARVELQVGSLALFLGPQSDLELAQLDDAGVLARLQLGHIVARVRTAQWARDLTLVTPELQLRPSGPGLFRVDRDAVSGGRSAAAALRGAMTVVGAGSRLDLASGQRSEVMGPTAGGTIRRTTLLQDDFAAWVAERDRVPDAPVAFALPEITGLDQLDQHGRWESHPDIGWVWMPVTVGPAWAPFRDGRWVWVRPWGWTWIDDAPWGFAPSNYGRWVQWKSRWVWAPSPIRHRPVPSPGWTQHPPSHGRFHRDDRRWGREDDRWGRDDHPPRIRDGEPRSDGQWRREGEERRMRIPRVEPGAGYVVPSAPLAQPAQPAPALQSAPSIAQPATPLVQPVRPAMPPGDSAVRPLPDRRHGFERREAGPPGRPERLDRPSAMDRGDQPTRADRPDRGERQRQLAQ